MMFTGSGWLGNGGSLLGLFLALLYVFAVVGAWALAVVRHRRLSR